jgi:uncharacterized protein YndB with AHSA1/START domain
MSTDQSSREPWTHEHKLTLLGSPARVFTALTDPNELQRWFCRRRPLASDAGNLDQPFVEATGSRCRIRRSRAGRSACRY